MSDPRSQVVRVTFVGGPFDGAEREVTVRPDGGYGPVFPVKPGITPNVPALTHGGAYFRDPTVSALRLFWKEWALLKGEGET